MKKRDDTLLTSTHASCGESFLGIPPAATDGAGEVLALDRRLARILLSAIGGPPISLVLWNGETIKSGDAVPAGKLLLRNRDALLKLLIYPELNFGDLYCTSQLDVAGDLTEFLSGIYLARLENHNTLLNRLNPVLGNLHRRRNTPSHSRRNIHHHYDLGNEFYRLWLDRVAMQYTCAYFPDPSMDLEAAQTAKLHHVCRKLRLQPGQTVVEAGCGWGGFALFMAREYGVNVIAYNISHEQVEYARSQARLAGLDGKVTFVEDDYRNIDRNCDVFVSIGMLEHVGVENFTGLGRLIDRCLDRRNGTGLIHTIGRNRPAPMNAWIEARIFPGGCPPSLGQMMEIFEPAAFSVLDVENLRLHYARTLEHWLRRFEDNAQAVTRMYDEVFTRAWRLYLCGSIAAFSAGQLQLYQVLFTRARNNDLPWSRSHLSS